MSCSASSSAVICMTDSTVSGLTGSMGGFTVISVTSNAMCGVTGGLRDTTMRDSVTCSTMCGVTGSLRGTTVRVP